jgi:2-polyprenyl-3-methyl-5-hydroxy-6-metoxy-1,4-benzoquinol methylase
MAEALGRACTSCRICEGSVLERFLDLGSQALANRFLKPGRESEPEPRFPLDVQFCAACGHVQLGYVVSPEVLFRDYIYVSSTSDTMPKHFAEYAAEVALSHVKPGSLVVEVASNDGCLLRAFRGKDVRTLGVEPATNIAKIANEAGVPTLNEFFSEAIAKKVRSEHGPAAAIIGNNVLAHVDGIHDFVRGLEALLAPDGTVFVEVPHLVHLVRRREFDTIYHEHLSYFSLGTLQELFRRFGMRVVDVKRVPVHGGSIRVYVRREAFAGEPSAEVAAVLAEERALGLDRPETYRTFAREVAQLRGELVALLSDLKAKKKRLAGYGAPAKGNTLLQYCGIGRDLLDFIVDRSPMKQGLLTPGTHVPIEPPEELLRRQPDAVLLLAWNFADEVLKQQAEYRSRGGSFVLPVPAPRILP